MNANNMGLVYDPATTTCAKTLITYIRVLVSAPIILAADIFWIGIFN